MTILQVLWPFLTMKLTVPAYFDRGIWYPKKTVRDKRADIVWSEAARNNAINAAAATTDTRRWSKNLIVLVLARQDTASGVPCATIATPPNPRWPETDNYGFGVSNA